MNKITAFLLSLTPLISYATMAYSAGQINTWGEWASAQMLPLMMISVVCAILFAALSSIASLHSAQEARQAIAEGRKPESSWARMYRSLVGETPTVAQERDLMLDHDYDGIHELDNSLPPWWLYTFYGSIAFGVLYMGLFFFSEDSLRMLPQYEAEMAEAKISVEAYLSTQANLVDETNAELLTDAAALARGAENYTAYCVACHAADGGGGVGPNLTDNYWLHGDGSVRTVFATIKHGVPEKGMIAWKTQLSAAEINEVTSYVVGLHGKTPAAPKEPQGELVASSTPNAELVQPESQSLEASSPQTAISPEVQPANL